MTSIARWINEHDATQRVNRSERTLRAWRQAGDIIAHRQANGRIMFLVESLDACKQLQQERYRTKVGRPKNP